MKVFLVSALLLTLVGCGASGPELAGRSESKLSSEIEDKLQKQMSDEMSAPDSREVFPDAAVEVIDAECYIDAGNKAATCVASVVISGTNIMDGKKSINVKVTATGGDRYTMEWS